MELYIIEYILNYIKTRVTNIDSGEYTLKKYVFLWKDKAASIFEGTPGKCF